MQNQKPWEFYADSLAKYSAMESWPLGMVKLAFDFAEDFAQYSYRVRQEEERQMDRMLSKSMENR